MTIISVRGKCLRWKSRRNALEEITKTCLNGIWIKSELVFIGNLSVK